MSSSSHPVKSSTGTGAYSTDQGRRGSGNVDEDSLLRRSTRLASKSKSNPSTSTSRTPSEEVKSGSSSLAGKSAKRTAKRNKDEENEDLTPIVERRITRKNKVIVAKEESVKKKFPVKRRASSVEQSDEDEHLVEKTVVLETKYSLRHRPVVEENQRSLRARKPASQKVEESKSSRMGAALHKSEAPAAGSSSSSSSSEEETARKSQPLTRSRSTKVAAISESPKEKETTNSDTIAQRVRRSHVDKRNPTKGSTVDKLKRAVTPVPAGGSKNKKEKEKKPASNKVASSKSSVSSRSKGSLSSSTKDGKQDPIPPEPVAVGISANMAHNNANKGASDPAGLANSVFSALGDLEAMSAEEFDVTRLQALLEARGLPSSLFSNLAPRFQQMLGRIGSQGGGSTQCYNKCTQLLAALKGNDESAQLAAASELCQMLVMGNEDTLHGFPIKQAVAALTAVIAGEGNYELVTQACRALSYMMESLPRSSAIVTGAIPAFLEKLQSIEYIDVAEQSLVALEMLSRRHAKQILRANGVQAVLNYIEFFSCTAQRNALMITSACCSNLTPEEFEFVQPVLPLLSQRLSQDTDKKCVENTCAAFSRIVDCFRNDAERLREIASHGLLQNIQHLLVVSPSVLSSQTFIMVIQMLTNICAACPDLAAHLLNNKITETLCFLLTGTPTVGNRIELSKSPRSPQECYELIRLIVSLLPDLPSDGLFAVDDLLKKVSGSSDHQVAWFWKDDSNAWIPYTNTESATIENAFRTHQEDIMIDTPQAQYVIDLVAMHQINEDTGTSREVRRQEMAPVPKPSRPQGPATQSTDPNVATFIRHIIGVLYEVYSTSAGAAIRHKCSEALLKMTYHASPDLLTTVMQRLPISSNIASNLATSDIKSVFYAIQLSDILMQKLPQTFSVHFRREGVVYQMNLCAKGESVIFKHQSESTFGASVAGDVVISSPVEYSQASSSVGLTQAAMNQLRPRMDDEPATDTATESSSASSTRNRAQAAARKAASRARLVALPSSRRRHQAGPQETTSNTDPPAPPAPPADPPPPPPASAPPTPMSRLGLSRRLASEGRAMLDRLSSSLSSQGTTSHPAPPVPVPSTVVAQNYRHQACEWIKNQAQKFLALFFPSLSSSQSFSLAVLIAAVEKLKLEKELTALKEIKQVIMDGSASPFEVIHSNVIGMLLKYLTEPEWQEDLDVGVVKRAKRKAKFETNRTPRRTRLLRFLNVFFDCPSEDELENSFINVFDISDAIDLVPAFQALVAKVSACVTQLEQYPVRVTDLTTPGLVGMGGSGGRHPIMRVFAHNQLKCTLSRHPDSPNIRQWRGGMVRVEPLAPIYTIERYLVTRGCARTVSADDAAPDTDEVSDEDELDSMSMAADAARNNGQYRLELLYNNHVLPYNWSLFQCIRHYARATGEETEGDSDFGAGQMALFTNTHTIHYRLVAEENAQHAASNVASGQPGIAAVNNEGESRRTNVWDTGIAPPVESPLDAHLVSKLPDYLVINDPSLEAITLLRVLFVLNYYWPEVYQPQSKLLPRLGEYDFLNSKLVTKMNRQLQDPMMILTGQIPSWMAQVAVYAPFLFPFESRLQLFYVTAFDRDRAMQRLLDANPDLAANRNNSHPSSSQAHDHMMPRIERRKRMVSRKNLLAQTQTIMDEFAHGRQFLEIQYQDEVGTGLGPTLEFYSMVSKEFQRTDLGLWHNASDHASTGLHVYAPCGLFPMPLGHKITKARLTEVEQKFRLLGKFMAKAVMDFRMTDIPFSPVFYKWLLGEEAKLGLADVAHIDPEIAKHLDKLHRIARRKKWLEIVNEAGDRKRTGTDEELLYDGSRIEDLCLTYTLPGYAEVDLCKGGHDKAVTLDNLDHYVSLVVHYFLREGVYRQMEAFRDAFNAIVPVKYIKLFRAEEMDALFCGHGDHLEEGWDVATLMETCHPDHGYTVDSQAVKWLFSIMSNYNAQERRDFVQFVTGSPKLPVGGFKALNPPFTVVKKVVGNDQIADQFLPSVMTCVNYLKLPDYTTVETMKKRLEVACKEGQHSFHLS